MSDSPRIALALSGGGAKGAFEAGVVAALRDEGIEPNVLAGTSAGAINAAAVAVGMDPDDLVDMWSRLQSRDVYRARFDLHRSVRLRTALDPRRWLATLRSRTTITDQLLDSVSWAWLLETSPLREVLVDVLGGPELDVPDDRALSVPAVDLTTGRLVRFTNSAPVPARDNDDTIVGPLTVDHLLASAAIPLIFQPHRVDGTLYWDGGLVANTPLRAALQHEPDVCVVVATGAVSHDADEPPSLGAAVALAIDHVLRFALLEDLDHARTVNELVGAAPDATKHKHVDFVLVAPEPGPRRGIGDLLDFEPDRARDLIEQGREQTHRALEEYRARR